MARLGRRLRLLSAISEWHANRMPFFPRQGHLYGPLLELGRKECEATFGDSYLMLMLGRLECVQPRRWLVIPPVYAPFQTAAKTYSIPPRTFNCRCVITGAKP